MPDYPGTDIFIDQRKERFNNKPARVAEKLRAIAIDPELYEQELKILVYLTEASK